MDAPDPVRAYYAALDDHDFDRLADLLAPAFVQRRPELTFEGRERFVAFMRDERPETDTTHAVDAVYGGTGDGVDEVAIRGQVLAADGDQLVRFVDVFTLDGDVITSIDTYTR